ncbi:MAG: glutamate 5-kinase [Opitutales bacterium]
MASNTVVIKIGTAVLRGEELGELNYARMQTIAKSVHLLRQAGMKVAIVSSGAVGLGMSKLHLEKKPKKISSIQKCAAVGQGILIDNWQKVFDDYDLPVAQILLTRDDVDDHDRHYALKELFDDILSDNVVPIINENDSISAAELNIKFGDNDVLSALIATLIKADNLIIISTAKGLLNTKGDGEIIPLVEKIDDYVMSLATSTKTASGTGGMLTKLKAAEIATKNACNAYIVGGNEDFAPSRMLLDGEKLGTFFRASESNKVSKKRWYAHFGKSRGKLIVDSGASTALKERGASLLSAGIVEVVGTFEEHDFVEILDQDKKLLARGLSSYSSAEILGTNDDLTSKIAVHRDNLSLL